MKFRDLIIILIFIFGCAPSFQSLINQTQTTEDPTYGYSINNPIKIGYYSVPKSIEASHKYISLLRTEEGKSLRLIMSGTTMAPEGIQKKSIPMRFGSNIKSGMLDFYMLVVEGTEDTLKLYFDAYQKGDLAVPVGLRIENAK